MVVTCRWSHLQRITMVYSQKFLAFLAILCLLQFCVIFASPTKRDWVVSRNFTENPSEIDDSPQKKDPNVSPRIYSMEIVSDIRLRYAATKVTSRVANPSTKAQEATFHVVLPDTAFISGFLMEIDGKVYKASVKEKEKAQEEYQNAVDAGQSAAQVTADARDANQFTVSVNIEPQAKMLFNLTYEELLTRRRGIYEQAIHVNPGSIVPKMSVKVNIFETLPVNKITVPQLRGNDISEVEDTTENKLAVITRENETVVHVVYEPTENQQNETSKNGLQGQFVVQYDVDRSSIEQKGGEIHVVDGYFVHFFAPSSLPILPKHVIFVLDTSGSMAGTRIEQTKQAMNSILDQLRTEDIFSVVEFSSSVTEWNLRKPYKGPENYWHNYNQDPEVKKNETIQEEFGLFDDIFAYAVTNRSVQRAKEFVNEMQVTSATNINDALLLALKNSQSVQSRLRLTPIIIFLTDGEPTSGVVDTNEILSNVRKANGDDVVSIFCLAFGTGTDFDFLTKVASQNRGFARKIFEAADATLQLKGFFDEVASPLLSNVRFIYNNSGPVQDVTETKVSNFFKGTEFVVAGRVEDASNLTAFISGVGTGGDYLIDCIPHPLPIVLEKKNTTFMVKSEKSFSLEKIWAYLSIQEMLKKRQITNDSETIANFNERALNLSLAYGFVTPLTSLVVVKPNSTATAADIRPADATSSSFGPGIMHSYSSSISSISAAGPSTVLSGPLPMRLQVLPFMMYDQSNDLEMDGVPSFDSPFDWINQFVHNDTHANIMVGNETLSLLWQVVLPDQDYSPCSASYITLNSAAFCKSIWKCATFGRQMLGVDSAACVIDNIYVGVCCATS